MTKSNNSTQQQLASVIIQDC